MTIAEKIAGILNRPNQSASNTDQTPWYVKYAGRALGIIGAFFAIIFGFYNALGIVFFNRSSLISGILQILFGFCVMVIEAPCCFFCIDYALRFADIADSRPLWNRAALYCTIAIPPIIIYPGLGSIFGCSLILGTGVVYGMMALGKKASRTEMQQTAVYSGFASSVTTNESASMVNNSQPFSFTGAVRTNSDV